jgi:hypothetical protein
LEVGNKAVKEFTIEENLRKMKEKWQGMELKTTSFK